LAVANEQGKIRLWEIRWWMLVLPTMLRGCRYYSPNSLLVFEMMQGEYVSTKIVPILVKDS